MDRPLPLVDAAPLDEAFACCPAVPRRSSSSAASGRPAS